MINLVMLIALLPQETYEYNPYNYSAEVVSVYDADTLTLKVDLGFGLTLTEKFRLYGIDAWEMRGVEKPEGTIARDWLRERLSSHEVIYLKSYKDKKGKYGRYLATLYVEENGSFTNLNEQLVVLGHAEKAEY